MKLYTREISINKQYNPRISENNKDTIDSI